MSHSSNKAIIDGLGRLQGVFYSTSSTVGTTPAKLTDPADVLDAIGGNIKENTRKVRLKNTHASQDLAWAVVVNGASAPTFTASGASTDGCLLSAGEVMEFAIPANLSIYVVGSAASTSYNVLIVDDGN